jgi:membrane peptidoglycan carboxypeptidase
LVTIDIRWLGESPIWAARTLAGVRVTLGLIKMAGLCLLAGVLVAGMLFPVVGGLGLASNQATDTVDSVSTNLVEGELPLVTTMTDAAGQPIAWLYDQNRTITPAEKIAPAMKAAIIAIEDRRFYEHDGVDWRGTTRALVTNQLSDDVVQGGSTLTMQYVKNYLLYVVAGEDKASQARVIEQTPARKAREIRIALQLERELSKEEILTRYLNIVNFGNKAYGVAAGASTYFGTTADKLTIAQAALLAGIVKSTTSYDPLRKPEEALKRRNLVIDALAEIGSITPDAAVQAKAEPLGVVNPLNSPPNGCVGAGPAAGFFCSYVINYLARLGITEEQLKRGGYVIKTTMDANATAAAKAAAEAEVPKTANGIANVMAIVQPGADKHRVTAVVANRDYGLDKAAGQTSYDLPSTTTKFGAGSIYKTFTSAAALEKGMGMLWEVDVPETYVSPTCPKHNGKPYTVENAGKYPPRLTLQDALASSPNTAFSQLIETTGVTPTVDMAYRLGMREAMQGIDSHGDPLEPGEESRGNSVKRGNECSFTLGPGPTGALELANVGATMISGGIWCPPSPVEQIVDRNGQPVALKEQPCEQAVPRGLADTMAFGLSKDTIPGGTGFAAANGAGWTRPMLGKTGTTQQHQSAGFVGATPQYAGAVLTFADGTKPQGICDRDPFPVLCGGNGNIYGGKVPARTWFAAMTPIHAPLPVVGLPPPDPAYLSGRNNTGVPQVIGRSAEDARSILEQAGFRVAQRSRDDAVPKGIVVAQSPSAQAFPGQVITIYVSSGSVPAPPGGGQGGGGGGDGDGGGRGGGGGGGGGGAPGPGTGAPAPEPVIPAPDPPTG